MTLQSFKKLTEEIGEEILTKPVFDLLFDSDYSNDGTSQSVVRYRLALQAYLPSEPSEISRTGLENRLYTSHGVKSDQVNQIGVIGGELFSRLMVSAAKKELNNFYISTCNGKCYSQGSSVLVKEYQGINPGTRALCIDAPHVATCLNLQDTPPALRETYSRKFLASFFKMIKKYSEQ
ncbi:hypothetical protein ACFSKU_14620 [Pontibacter silvestris]|uniref:Uncharacterized protein n=2 Tax=Pontibacter silvestris TaxID=2305183 RepID=A0ABW4WZG5_9BACT